MPPKRGIVKSGNSGNSSKAAPLPDKSVPKDGEEDEKKPLFPFGSKYPMSLLHERCQKLGWEKPRVDTRREPKGHSFSITLIRISDTRQTETVRLEPHPPYVLPSALEAKHWGATYALYRFSNNLSLNRVLPPGPRDYWNSLEKEHKEVPEHQKWMYEADPFAARKAVDDRQAKANKLKAEQEAAANGGRKREKPVTNEFTNAPEVKMAASLREKTETAIKLVMADLPELDEESASGIPESEIPNVLSQLATIGFQAKQARSAVEFLSKSSPFARNLLQSLSPLEACIEYLILHIPECDLPQRMLPDDNSSNSFVKSAHHGDENIKKRWIEDRAVKAGYPIRAVKRCTSNKRQADNWELTLASLNRMLIGKPLPDAAYMPLEEITEEMIVQDDDLEALWGSWAEPGELVLPINTADIKLHFLSPPESPHLTARHPPPMFISSATVAPYVRLHLLSVLLNAIVNQEVMESGTGLLVEAMGVLDGEWTRIEEEGPPDMWEVLKHLLPPPETGPRATGEKGELKPLGTKGRRKNAGRRLDPRTNEQVLKDFNKVRAEDKYAKLLQTRERLPSFTAKNELLSMLENHRAIVIVGETGCGKTTQVPQFILDTLIDSNQGAKASIIVTQPRRVAATSVATRVSAERMDDGSVGYAIRGESKQSAATKLLFCTTGVVLRRLSMGDALTDVTHIIVDEVHERSVDGDFLLLELKELLLTHPTLKVILMSATINHDTFIQYFDGAPLLSIPGFAHPVTDLYLEDVISATKYRPQPSRFGRKETAEHAEQYRQELITFGLDDEGARAVQAVARADRLDYQLIASVVKHITNTAPKKGGILIFLPGVQEITQCMEAVRGQVGGADVLPLHANLSSEDQRRVFIANPNKWKVVAATNVAETSITIDDVIYVIDSGKVKETSYDPDNGLSKLSEIWITRAAGRQRRGRAGRTQPGICYKLYTRRQEDRFSAFPIPEIKRVPLESIALSVKAAKDNVDVKEFLGRAVDPPEVVAMDKALAVLEELGATDTAGALTALGRHMSTLPVDLRLGKMLILATIFQCLNPILTIAACLSSKPLFLNPVDSREEASQARAKFARGSSDILTDANAYELCMRESPSNKRLFCEQNYISASTVRDVTSMRRDFIAALSDIGFIPLRADTADPALNVHSDDENLLKAVIAGALWPRVARVALPPGAIKYDKIQGGAVRRDNVAKDFKLRELRGGQVFLHPGSILFSNAEWRSPFVVYFNKHKTSKVFLRDATEVPMYALLLFGGPVTVNHVAGGLTINTSEGPIKLKAWPRIGILVNQLRRLLDIQLQRSIEDGTTLTADKNDPVVASMLALLQYDGLSS